MRKVLIFGLVVVSLFFLISVASAWWNESWQYRRGIVITNTNSETLTDYQVLVELNSANFDFSKAKSDGSDIRFIDEDDVTELNYWIEEWDSANESAKIWVRVPHIPANSTKTIYMYYGLNEQIVLRLLIASDGHYNYSGSSDADYQDIIDWMNNYSLGPDKTISFFVGDLVHDNPDDLPTVKSYFDQLNHPYYVVYGNHEHANSTYWQSLWGYPENYNFSVGEYAFIILNTSNENGDYLCPDATWLNEMLDYYSDKKVFIFQHIADATVDTTYGVDCPNERAVIQNHDNIIAILSGHNHDLDACYETLGTYWCFDAHFGTNWGTDYRGFRVIDIYNNGTVKTYQINGESNTVVNTKVLVSDNTVNNGNAVFESFVDTITCPNTPFTTYQTEVTCYSDKIHVKMTENSSGWAIPNTTEFYPPFIIEALIINSNDNGGVAYFADNDTLSAIGIWLDNDKLEYRLYKFDAGLAGDIPPSPVSGFSGFDTPHRLTAKILSTNEMYLYVDGEEKIHSTSVEYPSNSDHYYTGILTGNGETSDYVDVKWFFVRKYASTEPSISVGAEEEIPTSILLNVSGYVFYANNTPCNNPTVNVTNLNNGKEWVAETNETSNYYHFVIYEGEANASEVLKFEVSSPDGKQTNTTNHTITEDEINEGCLTLNFTLSGEPEFVFRNLSVVPTSGLAPLTINATAEVENIGGSDGECNATFLIDGEIEDWKIVDVAVGEVKTVSFTHTFNEAGSYDVTIDGLPAETVTVSSTTPSPSPTTITLANSLIIEKELGASYILWKWYCKDKNATNTTVDVFIDGSIVLSNVSVVSGEYLLSDVNENELHIIKIVNCSNASDYVRDEARTLPPFSFFLALLLTTFVLLVVTFATTSTVRVIASIFTLLFTAFTYKYSIYYASPLSYLLLFMFFFTFALMLAEVLKMLVSSIKRRPKWEEDFWSEWREGGGGL